MLPAVCTSHSLIGRNAKRSLHIRTHSNFESLGVCTLADIPCTNTVIVCRIQGGCVKLLLTQRSDADESFVETNCTSRG